MSCAFLWPRHSSYSSLLWLVSFLKSLVLPGIEPGTSVTTEPNLLGSKSIRKSLWYVWEQITYFSIALHIAAYGFISTSIDLANPDPIITKL